MLPYSSLVSKAMVKQFSSSSHLSNVTEVSEDKQPGRLAQVKKIVTKIGRLNFGFMVSQLGGPKIPPLI